MLGQRGNTMRFEINFDELPEYVCIRTFGEASVRGFDKLLTEIVDSPSWETGTKQLVDHRKLIFEKLISSDIQKVIDVAAGLTLLWTQMPSEKY
jgi:hypothetical protein